MYYIIPASAKLPQIKYEVNIITWHYIFYA